MKYENFLKIKDITEKETKVKKVNYNENMLFDLIKKEFRKMILDLTADIEQKNFTGYKDITEWLECVTEVYLDNIFVNIYCHIEVEEYNNKYYNRPKKPRGALNHRKLIRNYIETFKLRDYTKEEKEIFKDTNKDPDQHQ